jgi:hypothetical protein
MSTKLVIGGMGGVFVPIVIEFAAKGADIHPSFPVKWSGVIGVVAGAVPIVAVYGIDSVKRMSEDNKNALLAFGASSLATGISILVLEQLRKSAGYTFRDVEIGAMPRGEGLTAPVGQIIKEI